MNWWPMIGWGISTLLLWLLNRNRSNADTDTSSQQASPYTDSNSNHIGQPIPVVLGRVLIKNPLISYYGSFRADIYTEEYGMHSDLEIPWWALLLYLIVMLLMPSTHPVVTNTGGGVATDSQNGMKFQILVVAIQALLWWLLARLFNDHLGRTTIQKGFKYYLGWQHILCWTDDNIGIKRIWMNVYDTEVEESTEKGVWDNDDHVAYKEDNPSGITAYIEDDEMFGGPDEGGGFIGEIRFYFGTSGQQKDPWMVKEMYASTIPSELQGLTPKYPMFLTCVISDKNREDGAYIGKQATIPEMWFEIVNYPSKLSDAYKSKTSSMYNKHINELVDDILSYMANQDNSVQSYMKSYTDALRGAKGSSYSNIKSKADALRDNYPASNKDEISALVNSLDVSVDNGVWSLEPIDEDLNPAEAIYAILTNDLWGCNYDRIDDIDIDSLIQLGATCEEEKLGISALITSEAQAGQYIQKILNHINGIMYNDPYTGKLRFKLIRGGYDVKKLPVFTPSNCADMKFSRLDWSETSSAVSVNYTDADNKYEEGQLVFQDVANRFITRSYKESSVEGVYFTTSTNARWLAQVSQLASGYPLSTIEFTTNRLGHNIGLGDVIMVNWLPYGIKEQVFRVTDIDYATLTANAIKISAIEDIYGFATTKYAYAEVPEWKDPKQYATSIQYFMYMEMPYEITRSLDTYMRAYAARPTKDDIYYVNWRYTGTEYARRSRTNQWSMVAQLVYGTQEIYDEDNTGIEIEIIGAEARQMFDDKCQSIKDFPSIYTNRSVKNVLCIEGELLSYDTMTKLPNGHYVLDGVVHGIFDTVPKVHSAYSKVYFLDYSLPTNNNQVIATEGNFADEQLELRSGTKDNEEEFNIDDIVTFYTTRRSEQPSPMANLKFGAERGTKTEYKYNYPAGTIFAHDINFTFNLRNKFNQSDNINVHSAVNDAEPEKTSQYYIKVSCNGKDFEFKYDAAIPSGGSYTYPTDMTMYWHEFCENMGDRLQRVSDVQLEIGTYNKEKKLYSFDHYDKHLIIHVPRIVGILNPPAGANVDALAKAYADSIVTATHVELQLSTYIEFTTMTFEDAPLVVIASGTTTGLNGVTGQDGVRYILSQTAYRIDGANGDNNAVIHKITMNPEYVIQNDFTRAEGVNRRYYRLRSGAWNETNLYGET